MEIITQSSEVNPRKFSGQFYFTNPDTEDFTALWNNVAYHFPAGKTTPVVIMDAMLSDVPEIMRRWAIKLSQRRFAKTAEYRSFVKKSEGKAVPMFYEESKVLDPLVQECLNPAPVAELKKETIARKKMEKAIHPRTRREVTKVFSDDDDTSLVAQGEQAGNSAAF